MGREPWGGSCVRADLMSLKPFIRWSLETLFKIRLLVLIKGGYQEKGRGTVDTVIMMWGTVITRKKLEFGSIEILPLVASFQRVPRYDSHTLPNYLGFLFFNSECKPHRDREMGKVWAPSKGGYGSLLHCGSPCSHPHGRPHPAQGHLLGCSLQPTPS